MCIRDRYIILLFNYFYLLLIPNYLYYYKHIKCIIFIWIPTLAWKHRWLSGDAHPYYKLVYILLQIFFLFSLGDCSYAQSEYLMFFFHIYVTTAKLFNILALQRTDRKYTAYTNFDLSQYAKNQQLEFCYRFLTFCLHEASSATIFMKISVK